MTPTSIVGLASVRPAPEHTTTEITPGGKTIYRRSGGGSYRLAAPEDPPELLAKGINIVISADFSFHRIVPI
jgi:hypothetical protein